MCLTLLIFLFIYVLHMVISLCICILTVNYFISHLNKAVRSILILCTYEKYMFEFGFKKLLIRLI